MTVNSNINATRQGSLRTGTKNIQRAPVTVVVSPSTSNISGQPSQSNRPPFVPEVPPSKKQR